MVYMAPLHNHALTSWCTWHHRTSILRQMVYMAPPHKHTQTSWYTRHHRTSILRHTVYMAPPHKHTQASWCTWHYRTNILRQMVYTAPAQTGSPEPVDIKIRSWLYFASQCYRTKHVCTKHNLPIKSPLFQLHA